MKTIAKIIREHGGLEALLRGEAVSVCAATGRLLIEYAGRGLRGEGLKVTQYAGEKCTPVMSFELINEHEWFPYYYRNDETGEELHAYKAHRRNLKLMSIDLELSRQMQLVADAWDRQIRAAGFLCPATIILPL